MNTYREFTIKQQVIFYAVTLLVATTCVYFDLNHEEGTSHKEAQPEAVKSEPANNFLSGNEVAHSTFAAFEFK